jgi:hypothetical protein
MFRVGYVLFLSSRPLIERPILIRIKAKQPRRAHDATIKGIAIMTTNEGGAFIENIVAWYRGLRRSRKCLAELDGFRSGLEFLARDVNLSPWDLRALAAKWPGGDDLLRRRLRTLQLDLELISSAQSCALRDLQRVCTLCANKGHCERDLATGNAGSTEWRRYCLNAGTLEALQQQAIAGTAVHAEFRTSNPAPMPTPSQISGPALVAEQS